MSGVSFSKRIEQNVDQGAIFYCAGEKTTSGTCRRFPGERIKSVQRKGSGRTHIFRIGKRSFDSEISGTGTDGVHSISRRISDEVL